MIFPLYTVVQFFSQGVRGKDNNADATIDEIHEEWSTFMETFMFRLYCVSKNNIFGNYDFF